MTTFGLLGWLLAAFSGGLLIGTVTTGRMYQPLVDQLIDLTHKTHRVLNQLLDEKKDRPIVQADVRASDDEEG